MTLPAEMFTSKKTVRMVKGVLNSTRIFNNWTKIEFKSAKVESSPPMETIQMLVMTARTKYWELKLQLETLRSLTNKPKALIQHKLIRVSIKTKSWCKIWNRRKIKLLSLELTVLSNLQP